MKNEEIDENEIWKLIEEITKEVENFPEWKKQDWPIIVIGENMEYENQSK